LADKAGSESGPPHFTASSAASRTPCRFQLAISAKALYPASCARTASGALLSKSALLNRAMASLRRPWWIAKYPNKEARHIFGARVSKERARSATARILDEDTK